MPGLIFLQHLIHSVWSFCRYILYWLEILLDTKKHTFCLVSFKGKTIFAKVTFTATSDKFFLQTDRFIPSNLQFEKNVWLTFNLLLVMTKFHWSAIKSSQDEESQNAKLVKLQFLKFFLPLSFWNFILSVDTNANNKVPYQQCTHSRTHTLTVSLHGNFYCIIWKLTTSSDCECYKIIP